MIPEIYVPLLSALVGALVGTAGTVATVLIQARRDDRRHRREMVFKLATEQQAAHIELARASGGGQIQPVDIYLMHALSLLELLEEGNLTKESLEKQSRDLEDVSSYLKGRGRNDGTAVK